MLRIQAVFAHFNNESKFEASFRTFIEQAAAVCSHVLVVSTSRLEERNPLPKNVEVIERANIGYDFCSYRLGIELALKHRSFDRLLLANNSCFYGRNFNLKAVISELEKKPEEICGITSNAQFSPHLQSFFLYFKKSALLTNWFNEFWSLVQPLSSKDQLIFNYEIGLTSTATRRGLSCSSLFGAEITRVGEKSSFVKKLNRRFSLKSTQSKENPFFKDPTDLYQMFGILKWEFIKKNYQQNKNFLKSLSPEDRASISAHFATNNPQAHSKFDQRFDTHASANDWLGPIIYHGSAPEKSAAIGVVLHLFYPELLPEIIEQIALIPEKFEIIVTVTNLDTGLYARAMIREKLLLEPIVVIVENRGRDVLPFVHLINRGLLEGYEIVCKIHSKKSLYSEKGSQWRQEILTELLGTKSNLISILSEFRTNNKLGICGPSKTYLTQPEYWGSNRERLQLLAAKLHLTEGDVPLRFFAGTMFWIRSEILTKLNALNLSPEDFEEEKGQQDGTLAHALERLFLILAEQSGFHGKTCGIKFMELKDDSMNIPVVYH
jgi:lipopolysaccharide biosynthesis protein